MTPVLLVILTASSLVTAIGVVYMCAQITSAANRFFLGKQARDEADTVQAVTVTDALLRIEEAATAAKIAASQVAGRVDVATELGFQNAESLHRTEDADALVAEDLAGSIARADALPKDGNYGAAADAALRSAEEGT